MAITFEYPVDPDAYGVFDGRELAQYLIATAFKVLTPYVNGCPACADRLFETIANDVMEQLHEEGRREGGLPGGMYSAGSDEGERRARQEAHLEATMHRTAALLGVAGQHHH